MTHSIAATAAVRPARASAYKMDAWLKNSETPEHTLLIIKYLGDTFAPRNFATALRTLALQTRDCARSRSHVNQQREFSDLLATALQQIDKFSPGHLAQTLRSLAALDHCPDEGLLRGFIAAASRALPDFEPSSARNLLWACAKLGRRPNRKALHWLASKAVSDPHRVCLPWLTDLLWSFATLGYHPGAPTLNRLLAGATSEFRDRDSRSMPAILWALAKLGHHPGARALNRLSECLLADPDDLSRRKLSAALWALAVLTTLGEAPRPSTLRRLGDLLDRHRRELSQEDICRVFQAHLFLELLPGGSPLSPYAGFLHMARRVWTADIAAGTQGRTPSSLERKVATSLDRLGETYRGEHLTEDGCLSIDFGIVDPLHKIAVEVDGPTHELTTVSGNPAPNGPTLARNRLLAARGWQVVAVNGREVARGGVHVDDVLAAKLHAARYGSTSLSPRAWFRRCLQKFLRALGAAAGAGRKKRLHPSLLEVKPV